MAPLNTAVRVVRVDAGGEGGRVPRGGGGAQEVPRTPPNYQNMAKYG